MLKKYWIILFLIFLVLHLHSREEPILKQIGREFFSGLVKANYIETPIDQLTVINQVPFSLIEYPQMSSHPRLLFKANEISKIRNRYSQQPYSDWSDNIINYAINFSSNLNSPLLSEIKRSKAAKFNAFSWIITRNDEYLNDALTAMMSIIETIPPQNGEGGVAGEGWGDWMEASAALRNYAVTYDLIYNELTESQIEYIEERLSAQTNQIYQNFSRWPTSLNKLDLALGLGIPKNNHITKIAIGIASVSLVLDNPLSEKWFEAAIHQLQSGLAMIMADGSYMEGPGYGEYISYHLYPFMFYLKNTTGDNLFRHPQIYKFNKWMIDIELSNGDFPYLDDTWESDYFYKPIGVGLSPLEHELAYLYEIHADDFSGSETNLVEAFCAYNSRVKPLKPDYEHFYPDGGYTIFRSDDNEIIGSLSSEPGRPFISYHDHIEPASFTLFAFDKHFLIDCGSGQNGTTGNTNNNWYQTSRAHNIPLINGMGPDRNPIWGDELSAEMKDYFSMENVIASTVSSNYRQTHLDRRILQVNEHIFVVHDKLESQNNNRYSIPWHGMGNMIQVNSSSVCWEFPEAFLHTEFLTIHEKPFTLIKRLGLNSQQINDQPHSVAEISFPQSKEAELVSIFIPQKNSNKIICNKIFVNSLSKTDSRLIIDPEQDYSTLIVLAKSDWQYSGIQSDAKLTIIQEDYSNTIFSVESASSFILNDEIIFSSNFPTNITYDIENQQGFLSISKFTEIRLALEVDPGVVTIDNFIIDYTWDNGILTFKTNKSGVIRIGKLHTEVYSRKRTRSDLKMLEKLNSSLDPMQKFSNLNHYEKTELRNEITDITAAETFNAFNSIIGKSRFLQHIYGFTAGFFRSTYSTEDNFRFKLPQSFRFERNLIGYELKYYEEGFILPSDFQCNKHRINISKNENRIYYSYDQDFDNYQIHSLQFINAIYYARTDWQKFKSDISYLVELSKEGQNSMINLIHKDDDIEKFQQNEIKLRYRSLLSRISRNHYIDHTKYDFSIQHTGSIISNGVDLSASEENQLETVSLSNNLKIKKFLNISTSVCITDANDHFSKPDYKLYNSIYTEVLGINNSNTFLRDLNGDLTVKNTSSYHYKNWKFISRFVYDSVLYGINSISFRKPDFSIRTKLFKVKELILNGIYHYNTNWTSTARTNYNFKKMNYNEIKLGIFYNDIQSLGIEISRLNKQSVSSYIVTGIIELRPSFNDIIYFSPGLELDSNGEIKNYRIEIDQFGRNVSPGILIECCDSDFVRCEGYLNWYF